MSLSDFNDCGTIAAPIRRLGSRKSKLIDILGGDEHARSPQSFRNRAHLCRGVGHDCGTIAETKNDCGPNQIAALVALINFNRTRASRNTTFTISGWARVGAHGRHPWCEKAFLAPREEYSHVYPRVSVCLHARCVKTGTQGESAHSSHTYARTREL